MTLADWMYKNTVTNQGLGRQLGVSREYVRLWRHARRIPTVFYAAKIEDISNGAVTYADFERAYRLRRDKGILPGLIPHPPRGPNRKDV
jgi:hypothetical protein